MTVTSKPGWHLWQSISKLGGGGGTRGDLLNCINGFVVFGHHTIATITSELYKYVAAFTLKPPTDESRNGVKK